MASNSAFISYRRDSSTYQALAVFQGLTKRGVDCFYDIESIRAGEFEPVILGQIAARPYFILILTPGTLERCLNERDWLRREITYAVETKRVIIPVFTDDFHLSTLAEFLPTEIAEAVTKYNGMQLPEIKFFKYAMQELAEEFLLPVDLPVEPTSPADVEQVEELVQRAAEQAQVTPEQLKEERELEQGAQLLEAMEELLPVIGSLLSGADERGRPTEPQERGHSGTRAAEIVGITYRQLDYWARTDLVRPSITDTSGSGSRRRYSYQDLLELRMIKNLLDAGIRLETVRDVFANVRSYVGNDITAANLVIAGSQVVLCNGEELIEVVRRGQGVLEVLPLANVKSQIDEAMTTTDLTPPPDDDDGLAGVRVPVG